MNSTASPIPTTFERMKPIVATLSVSTRWTVMNERSLNSVASTRSGRGITNAGSAEK